jgi:hypothetical protein
VKKKLLRTLTTSALALGSQFVFAGSSALAQEKVVDNIYCLRNLKSSVTRVSKTPLPDGYDDLQDVQLSSDFRRPNKELPFSEAIAISDPVTGESVGVLDQNFVPGGSKVSSSWSRGSIAVSGYWLFRTGGGFGSDAVATFYPFEADILWIPDGDSFLIVKGCNGTFTVTKEIAKALANQSSSKNAFIRFTTEKNGGSHLSQIGKGTVAAWKKIYANWENPSSVKIESVGF